MFQLKTKTSLRPDAEALQIGGFAVLGMASLPKPKLNFRTTMKEGSLEFIEVEMGNQTLEFGGDMTVEGNTLTIDNFDIDGNMVNQVGISKLKEIASEFGKLKGVEKVIVNGAKRTTGANPGKITKLKFDVKK